jgi:drug/metabolite transporter (DMT)-like permease
MWLVDANSAKRRRSLAIEGVVFAVLGAVWIVWNPRGNGRAFGAGALLGSAGILFVSLVCPRITPNQVVGKVIIAIGLVAAAIQVGIAAFHPLPLAGIIIAIGVALIGTCFTRSASPDREA